MRRARVFAGLGGIAFGALTVVGFALAGPPGGSYKVANIADYLAHSHRPAVFPMAVAVMSCCWRD